MIPQLIRRSPDFWDSLNVPAGTKPAHLFSWLEETAPLPEEHDFVLSTDGSGCINGWGASASIIQRVLPGGLTGRVLGGYQPIVSATYGSTVQRREFSAFLDGLHEILAIKAAEQEIPEDTSNKDPLQMLTGDDRITVMWYTDRANLAKSLLFDEYGDVLNRRSNERDLWMRYSFMARHFCITPMWTDRNVIPSQAACDALCTLARNALKNTADAMSAAMPNLHNIDSWKAKRPQTALF